VIYLNGRLASTDFEAFWVGTSLVLHFLLKLWMAAEAPSQFHEDRRSGAMELLLTTPLTAQEIVSGRLAALWRRWRFAVGAVLAADVLQLALGVAKGQGNSADEWIWFWVARMTFLVADAWAFAWMGMWLGASTTGHRTTAPLLGLVLGIPWLCFLLYLLLVATIGSALFQALGEVGNILFALVGGTLNSVLWAEWGRRRLHKTFREWAILRPGERRQKGT
jgi:ABC-type Na+ efflux pump permease subunit